MSPIHPVSELSDYPGSELSSPQSRNKIASEYKELIMNYMFLRKLRATWNQDWLVLLTSFLIIHLNA